VDIAFGQNMDYAWIKTDGASLLVTFNPETKKYELFLPEGSPISVKQETTRGERITAGGRWIEFANGDVIRLADGRELVATGLEVALPGLGSRRAPVVNRPVKTNEAKEPTKVVRMNRNWRPEEGPANDNVPDRDVTKREGVALAAKADPKGDATPKAVKNEGSGDKTVNMRVGGGESSVIQIDPAAHFTKGHFYAHASYEGRTVVFHRGSNGLRIFFSSTKGVEAGRMENGEFQSSGPMGSGWHKVEEGTAFRINGNVYAF
jgi:hypothetical protein